MAQLAFAFVAAAAFAASLGYFLYAYLFLFGPAFVGVDLELWAALERPLQWNVLLFTAFALHHSVFARTGAKDLIRRLVPPALERALYTLVASILFVIVCWLWQPVPGTAWTLPGLWRWIGAGAQLAGIVLTIVGARALDVWELAGVRQVLALRASALRRTQGRPEPGRRTAGRHAPVDRLPVLKTTGLYGFVRHPLYFAWVLLVFGAPDMTMTRLSFGVISTLYLAVAIPFEERSLIETFGPSYASYRTKVRWRMIPWLW